MKYSEKLKDPRWQKLRLKILERDGWKCKSCGDTKSMLTVHHLYYLSEKNPWEYPEEALLTLCDECHTQEYEMRKQVEDDLLLILKQKGFLYIDVDHLAASLSIMEFQTEPSKIADVYGWAFNDPEIQTMLIKLWDEGSNG